MEARTLRAHFDGSRILLDEPFELEPNAKLVITVLPKVADEEREDWTIGSISNVRHKRLLHKLSEFLVK